MIKIEKPTEPPQVLSKRGAKARAKWCDIFESGEKPVTFNEKIYGHKSVREALLDAQHGKCAYCESRVRESAPVEHFRPKGRYYWLAYEWVNLFAACGECNSTYKGEQFPLKDETKRAINHHADLRLESPLLINPAEEDPSAFLGWREEVIFAFEGNQRGEVTIQVLGLDTPILTKNRRIRLDLIKTHLEILAIAQSEPQDEAKQEIAVKIREQLREWQSEASEFTAMVRSFLKSKSGGGTD